MQFITHLIFVMKFKIALISVVSLSCCDGDFRYGRLSVIIGGGGSMGGGWRGKWGEIKE